MKFSVIVPVYNTEKYLSQCVDSVLAQTFCDFELLLIDDGSVDSSGAKCDEYAKNDKRVKVIHTKNQGAAAARNCGIRAASGDYICFLDSDDYWDSDLTLQKFDSSITDATDILQMPLKQLFPNGEIRERDCDFSVFIPLSDEEKIIKLVDTERLMVSAAGMVIRRGFIEENNALLKEGIRVEDVEWAVRMLIHCPHIDFMQESFYVIRMFREGSVTSTVNAQHMRDYCEVIEDCIESIKCASDSLRSALSDYIAYHIYQHQEGKICEVN